MNDFELVKQYLKRILDSPTYKKRISPLSYIGTKNKVAFVGVEDKKNLSWLKNNLLEKINRHSEKEFGFEIKLVRLYDEDDDEIAEDEIFRSEIPKETSPPPQDKAKKNHNSNLHPKYTFENFVQVDQNRMAYSFAHSVSEFPGKSYNPLYIYSDVGLGKTHLLYAIGNRIVESNRDLSVIYITTSEFMHEYVEYNRLNKRPDFIKKFTSVDVLLIDDIQYITKWGGTSEQFYYIFNKLIQLEKQIVLCSDKHPDNIPDLESRIKSRFEWGGIVDIIHYDLEGRLAILKNKLAERHHMFTSNFEIPDDVLYFLASSVKDNVRKLEGALNRLIGVANLKYSDNKGVKITVEFAKEALKPIIRITKKKITIESIREYIAQKYNIMVDDLLSKSNKREIAVPRQIAMFICKKLTHIPMHEIGRAFGGKHHSTVLHSIKKVENNIDNDPDFAREINSIIKFFEQ